MVELLTVDSGRTGGLLFLRRMIPSSVFWKITLP
jgi:hypothetical protein